MQLFPFQQYFFFLQHRQFQLHLKSEDEPISVMLVNKEPEQQHPVIVELPLSEAMQATMDYCRSPSRKRMKMDRIDEQTVGGIPIATHFEVSG